MVPFIEQVFRTRIDYEAIDRLGEYHTEKVGQFATKIVDSLDTVIYETFEGNACCSPYIVLEGDNLQDINRAALKIIAYIKRFKNHKFV